MEIFAAISALESALLSNVASADSTGLKVTVFSMVCGWLQGIEKKWLTGAFCLQESNGLRSADSTGFSRTARREPIKGQARKNRAEATETL